jgi:hypothetical protein
MDYVYSALFIIALILALVGLNKLDARTKKKHKQQAYRLLDMADPDPKDVTNTIKVLRLYGGHWRKDKECVQLVQRLQEKI